MEEFLFNDVFMVHVFMVSSLPHFSSYCRALDL